MRINGAWGREQKVQSHLKIESQVSLSVPRGNSGISEDTSRSLFVKRHLSLLKEIVKSIAYNP